MIGVNVDKTHLIKFLSQAKLNQSIMHTTYEREGNDIIAVIGIIQSQNKDEIIINIDVESGGYLFE